MAKRGGGKGLAVFALLLSLVSLSYIFVIEPFIIPPRQTSWGAHRTVDFLNSNSTFTAVPELSISFDNTPAGLIQVQFYTILTNEPMGNLQFRIKVDTSVKFTSQVFATSSWDNVKVNYTFFIYELTAGIHTINVEVYGEQATSGIYNATLLVNYYSY